MVLLPAMPGWDVAAWRRAPAPVRLRMICQAWAAQGYGSPLAIHAACGLKILAYVGVWALACARIPGNDLTHVGGHRSLRARSAARCTSSGPAG